jgi:hypothetical protein
MFAKDAWFRYEIYPQRYLFRGIGRRVELGYRRIGVSYLEADGPLTNSNVCLVRDLEAERGWSFYIPRKRLEVEGARG